MVKHVSRVMASFSECYSSRTIDVVATVLAVMCNVSGIFIVATIGIVTIRRLQSEAKINVYLGILFFVAIICAFIIQTSTLIGFALCPVFGYTTYDLMVVTVTSPSILILMDSLLVSLILRLYFTFIGTAWEVPKVYLYLSMTAVAILTMLFIANVVMRLLGKVTLLIYFRILYISLFIFTATSIWAVWRFTSTLLIIAKLQQSSMKQVGASINKQQQELIHLSSKYVSLFIVATVSSTVMLTLSAVFRVHLGLNAAFIWPIDCVINIICLYLYHSFASHHYKRYCSRLDDCCRRRMMRNVASAGLTLPEMDVVDSAPPSPQSSTKPSPESPVSLSESNGAEFNL